MFIFKTGPGFSIGILQMLFGLYGIFLMQTLPQFALIFLLTTFFFRKTGKIYLGAYTAKMLTVWIMAAGGEII